MPSAVAQPTSSGALQARWVFLLALAILLPEFVLAKIEKDGHHHVIFRVRDNPVVEHAVRMYGSRSKVCSWFMGIYAAHGEMELGLRNVRLKENRCVCRGSPHCEWETKW